ncbi:MAG: hypothetical protein V2J07_10620 [Anaerolineae bacterium]|jgi:hypothetical protein|nr:hypothetical protein [Anaerolineae bacterium]
MEEKDLNNRNEEEMDLPEDGSQPDFEAVDKKIDDDFKKVDEEIDEGFARADKMGESMEEEFDQLGKDMSDEFDHLGEDLEDRFDAVGEKIEKKMEAFGDEMEKVGQRIGSAFEEAFGDVDEDGDNVDIHVDNSSKPVHKHGRAGGQTVFWGLAMIAVGAAVILSQLGILSTGFNWWAIFILVPGLGFLSGALDMLISNRRISSGVRSMFGTGILVLTVGGMFLFALDWSDYWPLILIAVGFSMFLNGFVGKKDFKSVVGRWFNRYGLWTGLSVMGLGAAFLLRTLGIFSMSDWYREWAQSFTTVTDGWWGLFLLLPGIGGLLHALIIILGSKRFPFAAIMLAVSGIGCLAVAVVAAMGLKWQLITPLVVIGAGFIIVLGELLHQIVKEGRVTTGAGKGNVDSRIVED